MSTDSIPSPPDLTAVSAWKSFGQTIVEIGGWAAAHPLITVCLVGVLAVLAFPKLIPEKWRLA